MKLRSSMVLLLWILTTPTYGYIDNASTLGVLIKTPVITVLRVDKVSREKGVILFKKVADLKGTEAKDEFKHIVKDGFNHYTSRTILDWAEAAQESGRVAIAFRDGNTAIICLGTIWYQCTAQQDNWWAMTDARPEYLLPYYGPTPEFVHIETMLAGKETIITCLTHGQNGYGAYFQTAFSCCPRKQVLSRSTYSCQP